MKGNTIISKIILGYFFWLSVPAVDAQTNTTVSGKLEDLQEGTFVYLSPISSSAKKDSVTAGKGEFRFNLSLEEGDTYLLRIGKEMSAPGAVGIIYLQPGEMKIKAKGPLLTGAEFSGSAFAKDQTDLNKFIKSAPAISGMDELMKSITEASKSKDSLKSAVLMKEYRKLDSIRTGLYKQWISRHPSSPVSVYALSFYVRERNMELLQEQLDQLTAEAKNNEPARKMQFSIDVSKATAIGKIAPDFVQNDTLGKPVALKDFRGKYLLVDFWASWCVPCRAENPNVVKAFHKYKANNFTILGVSLDRPGAKDKWIKAIHDDGLAWTHVSDLKWWDNEVSNQYDIKAIPANLLIGPDGRILAKNIRGEELDRVLTESIK